MLQINNISSTHLTESQKVSTTNILITSSFNDGGGYYAAAPGNSDCTIKWLLEIKFFTNLTIN